MSKHPELKHSKLKGSSTAELPCELCYHVKQHAKKHPTLQGSDHATPEHCGKHCHTPDQHPMCEPLMMRIKSAAQQLCEQAKNVNDERLRLNHTGPHRTFTTMPPLAGFVRGVSHPTTIYNMDETGTITIKYTKP